MRLAAIGRPLGCLEAAFKQARQDRTWQRSFATAATPTTVAHKAPIVRKPYLTTRQRDRDARLQKFEIYPQVPSVLTDCTEPMVALRQALIAKLDPTGARTRLFSKEQADAAKPGDCLLVSTKKREPFAGALIEIRRRGVDTAILLRGQLMRTSVEMWFKIYSPTVTAINIVWRRPKRARRARLTYMRNPKHDMGNVDHLVYAWRKERSTLRANTGYKGPKQQNAKSK